MKTLGFRPFGLDSTSLAMRGFLLLLLLTAASLGQTPTAPANPVDLLPQDTGAAGLRQMLRRLGTTARLMQVVAHPDDEDGGMMTLESRGEGVTVVLMTLTRGEGGQNKVGSNLFDVLGVVRTLELTAADRYYGVDQRFSHVADFGYSKIADETFRKWQGHELALGDIVRVIREFRPDVLAPRFSGTERDGHGHHQASSILAQEAFRAAADPKRFPEQIKAGLLPWQAKKLYIGNVCGFGAMSCPADDYTVRLNTGVNNSDLGGSYIQFAMQGLKHQLSQGAGAWTVDPGDRFTFYRLVDSAVNSPKDKDGHEKDFWDGIDTSLPGLATQMGNEEKKVPWLKEELVKVASEIREADEAAKKDTQAAAGPLHAAATNLRALAGRVEKSDLSAAAKLDLLTRLEEKQQQAESAFNLAMNVSVEAFVESATGKPVPQEQDALVEVSPGQKFDLHVKFHNGSSDALLVNNISLEGFQGWEVGARKLETHEVEPGQDYVQRFTLQVPAKVAYTRPYWHRDNPERDSLNIIDEPKYFGLPFPPYPYRVRVKYAMAKGAKLAALAGSERAGEVSSPAVVRFLNEKGAEDKRRLAVVPIFSVMLDPGEQVIPVEGGAATTVKVSISCNRAGTLPGSLRLEMPDGWRAEPEKLAVKFTRRGEKQDFEFKVIPSSLKEGRAQIRAVLTDDGTNYSEGYSAVTREDLDTFYYYQPAVQRVSIVEVKVPKDLKVGYIMGAGDDIPTVLKQIGMDVTLIPAESLASADLSKYGTIVLGIRAYDTQKEVVSNNKKLLEFVSAGGTLVVQYNASTSDFNSGHFTPYPATMGRARVSVEEAPLDILAPDNSVFHVPNQITEKDFDGWVQERGLYFMNDWDSHFVPLLASHDPGEPALKGGLLRAQYGKGTYIFNGYAFFRQLPAGVPGAIRLYVNILNAGRQWHWLVGGSYVWE